MDLPSVLNDKKTLFSAGLFLTCPLNTTRRIHQRLFACVTYHAVRNCCTCSTVWNVGAGKNAQDCYLYIQWWLTNVWSKIWASYILAGLVSWVYWQIAGFHVQSKLQQVIGQIYYCRCQGLVARAFRIQKKRLCFSYTQIILCMPHGVWRLRS